MSKWRVVIFPLCWQIDAENEEEAWKKFLEELKECTKSDHALDALRPLIQPVKSDLRKAARKSHPQHNL